MEQVGWSILDGAPSCLACQPLWVPALRGEPQLFLDSWVFVPVGSGGSSVFVFECPHALSLGSVGCAGGWWKLVW